MRESQGSQGNLQDLAYRYSELQVSATADKVHRRYPAVIAEQLYRTGIDAVSDWFAVLRVAYKRFTLPFSLLLFYHRDEVCLNLSGSLRGLLSRRKGQTSYLRIALAEDLQPPLFPTYLPLRVFVLSSQHSSIFASPRTRSTTTCRSSQRTEHRSKNMDPMGVFNRKTGATAQAQPATPPSPEYNNDKANPNLDTTIHPDSHLAHMTDPKMRLHRGLKARQVTMIAIGGAIGTGLIIGTGAALARAGPGSILISYTIVGFIVYLVMCALGEMAAWLPLESGFTGYAARFCDPALGFALGYTYWFKYIIVTPNQLTAAALVIQYWVPREKVNPGVFIAVFLVVIIAINYLGIRFFGEFEFWLSSLKVLTIVGLILLSLILMLGGGPDHDRKVRKVVQIGLLCLVPSATALISIP